MKSVAWIGTSLSDIRNFPADAQTNAGHALRMVQEGVDPTNWKPLSSIGVGVREIRVREQSGAFRVVYVAKFADKVFVLHCFQKKTEKTAKRDIDIAKARLKEIRK